MRAYKREPWGQRPDHHEMIHRVLIYIHLGYSVKRLVELFGVREKTAQKLKERFG